ncbi:hypothetical protein NLJ89_g460 [Agrocybe chaxingu]|uniref:N-acetyltransferase domain-containing protein n=1 Tax=Agrocybe chaxingu TaxID=84603 RepID=A0A9W8N1X5_9AGAR|nr:hypothetical protein NLJ89_g460 [Agrocybe chaxingu]
MFDLECGVRLRGFRPKDDLDSILALYHDIRVAQLITEQFIVPRGEKLKEQYKDNIANSAEMFCIIETIPEKTTSTPEGDNLQETPAEKAAKDEPKFVGFTALWQYPERGHRLSSFSLVLRPEFWNKGYGTQITKFMVDHAFLHLNMHRIGLEVYEGNERAMAVYRKIGFVDEGRQRKTRWVDGGWKDTFHMGILVDDWKQNRETLPQN